MKKVDNCFVVPKIIYIFADANEKMGGNAFFDILQDRQKRADLIESGKFLACTSRPTKVALESSLACPVSFPKDTDCFTIFVLPGNTRTLSGEYVREACPSAINNV